MNNTYLPKISYTCMQVSVSKTVYVIVTALVQGHMDQAIQKSKQ